jgi:hypothetical protein
VDEEHIYITLQDTSPAVQAQAAATTQAAALNQQLQQQIQDTASPQELLQLLQASGDSLNYLNVVLACERAVQLCAPSTGSSSVAAQGGALAGSPAASGQPAKQQQQQQVQVQGQQQQQQQQVQGQLVEVLGRLALQQAAAFQAAHFAQVRWGVLGDSKHRQ